MGLKANAHFSLVLANSWRRLHEPDGLLHKPLKIFPLLRASAQSDAGLSIVRKLSRGLNEKEYSVQ